MPTMTSTIRDARERSGLTQVQLAVAAGVSPATIYRIESGRVTPTDAVLKAINAVIGSGGTHEVQGSAAPTGRGKTNGDATTAAKRSRVPAPNKEQ